MRFFLAPIVFFVSLFGISGVAEAHTDSRDVTHRNDSRHPWTANGCGPQNSTWKSYLIPDRTSAYDALRFEWYRLTDFNHACDHHDGCYAGRSQTNERVWVSRTTCDNRFLVDMKSSCAALHGTLHPVRRSLCNSRAEVYMWAVKCFGFDAYAGPSRLKSAKPTAVRCAAGLAGW